MDLETKFLEKIDALTKGGQWTYAKFVCLELLYSNPNCIAARKFLGEIRQHTRPSKKIVIYSQLFIHIILALFYMLKIRKKPKELLLELESLLDVDPDSPWVLRLLSEVAFGFGFVETAIFSLQCIPEEIRDMDDWLLMGESYLGSSDFINAIKIANKVLLSSPDNLRARDLLWQASVSHSMDSDEKSNGL
ncbi:MAG: hypothetical protein LBH49_00985 [Puniceicoccales bacterium]|nr:hypothetical protein [Puniceicoccales bacterium]